MSFTPKNMFSSSSSSASEAPRVKMPDQRIKQYAVHDDDKRRFFINVVLVDCVTQIQIVTEKCQYETDEWHTDLAGYNFTFTEWGKFSDSIGKMFEKMAGYQEGHIKLEVPKSSRNESNSEN